MSEEVNEAPVDALAEEAAPKKGRRKVTSEVTEPVNTIIDLGTPLVVVTKPSEPVEVEPEFVSEQTIREMEAGRRHLEQFKRSAAEE